jgi:ATP-dependent helicase YprA (DUF1998 family)
MTSAPHLVGWEDLLDEEAVAYRGIEPARSGREEPLPEEVDPALVSALVTRGITSVWRHQAEAWEAAARGENVIVTTGTASGKSLAFNLPVLTGIRSERSPSWSSRVCAPRSTTATRSRSDAGRFASGQTRS